MSLERKQHADLVRHREFNALRRLIMARDPRRKIGVVDQTIQVSRFESTQAINQINALEVQMSKQISSAESLQDFGHTRINPITHELEKKPRSSLQATLIGTAADHFANNRMSLVQTVLAEGVGEGGPLQEQASAWLAYMDLCRATDEHDRFESFALDFSVRFGRSAPPWHSFLAQAEAAALEHTKIQSDISGQSAADWTSPIYLSQAEIQALETSLLQAQSKSKQIMLDFRALASVNSDDWVDFRRALTALASSTVRCRLLGLSELSLAFDRQSAEAMLTELAAIRCTNQQQVFEDLAFEYCIKYEVSPPDWHAPFCRLEIEGNQPSSQAETQPESAELYGTLEGEQAASMMKAIESFDGLVVRCDRLVRCDQVAALILVQWGQSANRLGHQIEFHGLHRLLEPYLASQGLAQYVKMVVRKD